jgi:hypothetical protein
MMNTGGVGNGISDKSAHTTDPETGFPKSGSKIHVANTYEYARLV